MLGQLALDGLDLTHQYNFDVEIPGCQQSAFNHCRGGVVPAHRVDGDFWHREGLALLTLDDRAPAIKAAMAASAMRQNRFAAVCARAPLRFGERVMGAALVPYSF